MFPGSIQPITPATIAGKKTFNNTSEILVSPSCEGFKTLACRMCLLPKVKTKSPINIPTPAVMNAGPQPYLLRMKAAIILQINAPILIPI